MLFKDDGSLFMTLPCEGREQRLELSVMPRSELRPRPSDYESIPLFFLFKFPDFLAFCDLIIGEIFAFLFLARGDYWIN